MEKVTGKTITKTLFGLFSAAIVLVLPLRTYQYLKIIEPGTGFYKTSDISVWLLYAALALFCLALFVVSLLNKKRIRLSQKLIRKPVNGAACVFFALTLIVNAVTRFGDASSLYFDNQNQMIMKSGVYPLFFEAVFAVLAALYLAVLAIGYFNGRADPSEYKLLAITPLLWSICRILHRFMRTISFVNVSDLFYELFMLVFLMLFFMAMAQVVSRVGTERNDWKLFAYGLPAGIFCLLCFVPRAILVLVGKSELLAVLSGPEVCDLGAALFILSLLLGKMTILDKKDKA